MNFEEESRKNEKDRNNQVKRDYIDIIESTPSVKMTCAVLIIGVLAIIPGWINYDIISKDGANFYIPVARLFMQWDFREAISSPLVPLVFPLYEILIGVVSKISGLDFETSGRLISVVSFVLGSLGVYKVSEIIFKERVIALLSVMLFISNRELLWRSVDCLKESLLVCLVLWGNYFIIKGIYCAAKNKYFVFGVLLLLAGGLVRSTSLIFLGGWLIIWVFQKKDKFLKRSILLFSLIFLIIFIYYLNLEYKWKLAIFRRSYNLYALVSKDLNMQETIVLSIGMLRQFLAKSYYLFGLFACIGLYWTRQYKYSIHVAIVTAIFFIICIRTTKIYIDRYTIVLIVWLYPLAAFSIVKSLRGVNKPIKIMAVIAVVMCPILWADKSFTPPDPDKLARKEAGQYILAQIGPDQDVITNRDRLAFYAGARYVPLVNTGDIKNSLSAIAVDVEKDEGEKIKEHLDALGKKPDQVFRTIYVYIPKS